MAPPLRGLDSFGARYAYEGEMRSLLLALKYGNRRDALRWLGGELAAQAASIGSIDAVTWAPTSRRRAGRRGYDQAELLARATATALRVPARGLLSREGVVAQTGLDAAARRAGPRFVARPRVPPSTLLVDDVATTGATLEAAAAALRARGAREVHAVVVARTPRAQAHPGVAGLDPNPSDPTGVPACRSPSAAARR